MQRNCQICGHSGFEVRPHYTPSRGYSCFECDVVVDLQATASAAQSNQYSSDQPCTKCNRRNTRPIRYPVECCPGCAGKYRLAFNIYVVDQRTKYRHPVVIDSEKTIGVLARRVSRFGGAIEYKGVLCDARMTIHAVGIQPGETVVFHGTPDEYIDSSVDH